MYNHSEAFCLMKYRSDDGTEEEIIWNSRDGVTPFVISLRSGKPATHVDWKNDRCVPDYEPKTGERIFVDLTYERALEHAYLKLLRDFGKADAQTAKKMARDWTIRPGQPDLIEVGIKEKSKNWYRRTRKVKGR